MTHDLHLGNHHPQVQKTLRRNCQYFFLDLVNGKRVKHMVVGKESGVEGYLPLGT